MKRNELIDYEIYNKACLGVMDSKGLIKKNITDKKQENLKRRSGLLKDESIKTKEIISKWTEIIIKEHEKTLKSRSKKFTYYSFNYPFDLGLYIMTYPKKAKIAEKLSQQTIYSFETVLRVYITTMSIIKTNDILFKCAKRDINPLDLMNEYRSLKNDTGRYNKN